MPATDGSIAVVGSSRSSQGGIDWQFSPDVSKPDDYGWVVSVVGFVGNLKELALRYRATFSPSPSITLARLFECRGERLLEQLQGNFALCALDRSHGRVLAARDRLGGRTLFYTSVSGSWFLADRASRVLALAGLDARPNPAAMACHFAGQLAPPTRETAFSGVQELLPGEILIVDRNGIRSTRRLRDLPLNKSIYGDPESAVERFSSLFDRSVAACLPEAGPVACMLSGGMDSGPVAESATRQWSRSDRRLLPISWSLPQYPEADESRWIKGLSRFLGLQALIFESSALPFDQLHTEQIDPDWPMFNAFRPLIDECYRLAAESGCHVILNGNAGDDIYASLHHLYRGYWHDGDYRLILQDLRRVLQRGGLRALRSHPPLRHLLGRLRMRSAESPPDWLTGTARRHWQPDSGLYECFGDHPIPEFAQQLLGPRMTFGRAQESFFTSRQGVERRDPFHDEGLVGFMLYAPFRFSVQQGRTKWIMREACKERLPEAIRRKQRTGLMSSYYQAGLVANRQKLADLLFRRATGWQEWVEPAVVRELLDQQSGAPQTLLTRCIGHALWECYWSGIP